MPLLNLLNAFATGAATFSLAPSLPAVEIQPKSSAEAFSEDAAKLQGDFGAALESLKTEIVQSRGPSVAPKA